MTLTEFMAFEAEQVERHEFWRGEVLPMVGSTARQNRIILNLAHAIARHLEGAGCQVFISSIKLQLAEDGVLYPDVMVTCGKTVAGDDHVVTDAKLIIEMMPAGSGGIDKRSKIIFYRRLVSLCEYVLIEPAKRAVAVFVLTDAGDWSSTDQTRADVLTLQSIGLELPMRLVFSFVR